jgi:hypothetical protein
MARNQYLDNEKGRETARVFEQERGGIDTQAYQCDIHYHFTPDRRREPLPDVIADRLHVLPEISDQSDNAEYLA